MSNCLKQDCHSDHGALVCDCGCAHVGHTNYSGCRNHNGKSDSKGKRVLPCDAYSQKLRNTELGKDVRKYVLDRL